MACLCTLSACKHDAEQAKSTEKTSSPPAARAESASTTVTPKPIPDGYDFPGQRLLIQEWANSWNTQKMNTKAWNLWAGLQAGSGQTYANGAEIAIWDTWAGEEVFTEPSAALGARKPSHRFHRARQFHHSPPKLKNGSVSSGGSAQQLVSFNKFNPSMAAYLRAGHSGPVAGKQYQYTQFNSLAQLNEDWPANTPIANRKVQEAPYTAPGGGQRGEAAMELKPVLFLVKQSGLTPVPLWQGLAGSVDSAAAPSNCQQGPTADCHPEPGLWTTCVLVDPTQNGASPNTAPVAATQAQIQSVQARIQAANTASTKATGVPAFSCSNYLYAPLSTLYAIPMDAEEASAFNAAQTAEGMTAEAGDYAVLVAMHASTKEIVNWTWQTFWWQPGTDTPDNFPGSKAGMTDKVAGVARNYAMCAAYNQTQGNKSKAMAVCFNPYLETSPGIPDGVQSNCMSCHGTATVNSTFSSGTLGSLSYPSNYTAPIDFEKDPRFAGYTRTDFAWSIQGDPTPVSAPPKP